MKTWCCTLSCTPNGDVDGSADLHLAAWSVVLADYDEWGYPALRGCLSAPVPTCPDAPEWIGALHHDNLSAELTAVSAVMIVSLCAEVQPQVVIRPDLRLSAMPAGSQ